MINQIINLFAKNASRLHPLSHLSPPAPPTSIKGGGDSWHFRLIATSNGYFNLTDIGLLIIILRVAVIDLCFQEDMSGLYEMSQYILQKRDKSRKNDAATKYILG